MAQCLRDARRVVDNDVALADRDTEDFDDVDAPQGPAWADLGDFGVVRPAEDALARSEVDAPPLISGVVFAVDGCLLAARVGMIDSVMLKLSTTSWCNNANIFRNTSHHKEHFNSICTIQ